jgi:tetratricopeptide (TPR) repeat protein
VVCKFESGPYLRGAEGGQKSAGSGRASLAEPASRHDYEGVFARVADVIAQRTASLAEEQATAPALLAALAAHPVDRQRLLVTNCRRYRTWALAQALIDESAAQLPRDPPAALTASRVAVAAVACLDAGYYGAQRIADLAAAAWASHATALRIAGDFREAEKALASAYRQLAAGTGDPLERARLLWHEASFRRARRQFDRAFALLEEVIAIARRQDEPHLWGKALINKGVCYSYAGEPEAAIRLLQEGTRLIDPGLEPRLLLVARHNLIDALVDAERFEEAQTLLAPTRALHLQFGNRIDLIRFRWVEGKVTAGLGQFEVAEELCRTVRDEFVAAELGYDAALVSLDLAALYSRQGRSGDVRRLAEEMLSIFQAGGIHREALAALKIFREAAELERVTLGLVQELSEFLLRARQCPDLRFHLSALKPAAG